MRVACIFSLLLVSSFTAAKVGHKPTNQAGQIAHPKGAHKDAHQGAKQGGQHAHQIGEHPQHQQPATVQNGEKGVNSTVDDHKGNYGQVKKGGKNPDHQKPDKTPKDGHDKDGNATSPNGPKPAGAYPMPMPCFGNCTTYLDNAMIRRESDGLLFRFLMRHGRIFILTAPHISGPWVDAKNNNTNVQPGLENAVLPNGPVKNPIGGDQVPDNDWAPDVHYFKTNGGQDKYVLLYSDWNTPDELDPHWNGTLSYAISDTMDPGTWKDMGSLHLPQPEHGEYTLIGPNLLVDSNPPSLSFSSFADGFYHVNMTLDPFAVEKGSAPQMLIADEKVPGSGKRNTSEGSFQFQWDKWTYLFFSRGRCCVDETVPYSSVYRVEVCRAPSPQGPYSNKEGHSCLHPENGGRGTVILESHGGLNGVYGPGSVGVMNDPEEGLVMFYQYNNRTIGMTVETKQFGWNYLDFQDGWPVIVAKRGGSKSSSQSPSDETDIQGPTPQSGKPKDRGGPKDEKGGKSHNGHEHKGSKGPHDTNEKAQVAQQKEQKKQSGAKDGEPGSKPSIKESKAQHGGKDKHHHKNKTKNQGGHKAHDTPKAEKVPMSKEMKAPPGSGPILNPNDHNKPKPGKDQDGNGQHKGHKKPKAHNSQNSQNSGGANGQKPNEQHPHGKKPGKHDGKGGQDGQGKNDHRQHPKPKPHDAAAAAGSNSTSPQCKHRKGKHEHDCRNGAPYQPGHQNGTTPHHGHRNKTSKPDPVPVTPTNTAPAPLYSTGSASACFAPRSQVLQYTFTGTLALLFSFLHLWI